MREALIWHTHIIIGKIFIFIPDIMIVSLERFRVLRWISG
jgi:hypothetical protein